MKILDVLSTILCVAMIGLALLSQQNETILHFVNEWLGGPLWVGGWGVAALALDGLINALRQ